MSSLPVQDRLLKLIETKRSPHFILFSPHPRCSNPSEASRLWIEQFLSRLGVRPQGHQDILQIHPDQELSKSGYTLEHPGLKEWFSSEYYRPVELPLRLVILTEAQLLSPVIQNKCLRSLEEPGLDQCILWFKSSSQSLLTTIESRAIHWRLDPLNDFSLQSKTATLEELHQSLPDGLSEALKANHWQEVASTLQGDPQLEQQVMKLLLDYERQQPEGLKRKAQLVQHLKWFREAQQFGNAHAERWTTLLAPYFSRHET